MSTELIPVKDMQIMAASIAKSGLFGMKTPDQALALMLIAQAEGMHPAIAARDYNVIQGRPALKADALLARFQAAGGKVEWHEYTDAKVGATFSHPQGGSIRIDWDMKRAANAGLSTKDNWKKYPRQMLKARVVSEGIRAVYPGCSVGIYTVEEVQDMQQEPVQTVEAEVIDPESGNGKVSKQQLDEMAAIVGRIKKHLPDAEVITLRKLYREGCTEERYREWMDHLRQIDEGIKAYSGNGNGGGEAPAEIDQPSTPEEVKEFEEAAL